VTTLLAEQRNQIRSSITSSTDCIFSIFVSFKIYERECGRASRSLAINISDAPIFEKQVLNIFCSDIDRKISDINSGHLLILQTGHLRLLTTTAILWAVSETKKIREKPTPAKPEACSGPTIRGAGSS
jgi:hypothetical protein